MSEVKEYRSKVRIRAIKLADFASIPKVNEFVGLPTNVEFQTDGSFRIRVVRSPFDVVIINQGQCVYKTEEGALKTCTEEWLQSEYEEVTTA
ncbi:hypothetical protein D3C74_256230 [compost metagenome]